MKKRIIIFLSYIILITNSNLLADEKNKSLKIGLLAPLTGEYAELGNSLLYSLQLALEEIGGIQGGVTDVSDQSGLGVRVDEIRRSFNAYINEIT